MICFVGCLGDRNHGLIQTQTKFFMRFFFYSVSVSRNFEVIQEKMNDYFITVHRFQLKQCNFSTNPIINFLSFFDSVRFHQHHRHF